MVGWLVGEPVKNSSLMVSVGSSCWVEVVLARMRVF